jgi:hypothetical protein
MYKMSWLFGLQKKEYSSKRFKFFCGKQYLVFRCNCIVQPHLKIHFLALNEFKSIQKKYLTQIWQNKRVKNITDKKVLFFWVCNYTSPTKLGWQLAHLVNLLSNLTQSFLILGELRKILLQTLTKWGWYSWS